MKARIWSRLRLRRSAFDVSPVDVQLRAGALKQGIEQRKPETPPAISVARKLQLEYVGLELMAKIEASETAVAVSAPWRPVRI